MKKNWYRDSYDAIVRLYGDDAEMFAALLAITSANNSVSSNVTLARKAYWQIRETGTVKRSSFVKCHYTGILQYLSTGRVRGRKCSAFYECLIDEQSQHIPVDIWMMRLYHIKRDSPSKKEYDRIEGEIVRDAERLGMRPRDYQAELWEQVRGNGSCYGDYMRQMRLL